MGTLAPVTSAKSPKRTRSVATRFSLVPLLLSGQSISPDARQALRENRVKDAANIIMKNYGLSCGEVGDLLNVKAC